MKKKNSSFETLSDFLQTSNTLRQLFQNDSFLFFQFQKKWSSFVGEYISKNSYIEKKENNTLIIRVRDSSLLQQLFMFKKDILQSLQNDPYGKQFKSIRFYVGKNILTNSFIKENNTSNIPILTKKEKEKIDIWTKKYITYSSLQPIFKNLAEEISIKYKTDMLKGYHPCSSCGILCLPSEKICILCQNKKEHQIQNKVILFLKNYPHLHFEEVQKQISSTYHQYSSARNILINRYKDLYYMNNATKEEQKKLIALLLYKSMNSITDEDMKIGLAYIPHKK